MSRVVENPRPVELTLEPFDDYVVIEASDLEAETRGGLILPASAETQCRTGIITAAGPEADGISPGDKVLYPREAGFDARISGTEVRVMRRGDLIARVHD